MKKQPKRLRLNKETIVNLSNVQMEFIKGGALADATRKETKDCNPGKATCLVCSNTQTGPTCCGESPY